MEHNLLTQTQHLTGWSLICIITQTSLAVATKRNLQTLQFAFLQFHQQYVKVLEMCFWAIFRHYQIVHVYDAMSALCASHSLSAKDLSCARHAARCAICQTDHIIMFPFTWNGFDHPHLKTAKAWKVKLKARSLWDGRFIAHIRRRHPFSLRPATPRSRCLQRPLQGADKVTYRDWHSVHVPPVKGPALPTWPPALWQG